VVVDPIELRRALSLFPTGVTVVATRHVPDGACGLTANAFTSVSLEPPLVLVSLDRSSNTFACIEERGFFSVNVLAEGQEELAIAFARKGEDKFGSVEHRLGKEGAPLVDGAALWLECRVEAAHPGGDHTILVAQVERAEPNEDRPPPLVFHSGAYTTVEGLPTREG
jgi:3-hydroxy-9,10-secoandrosta-1,3,5(10)-triene-9,17-dione monooxygenase reductase component